ncbi:MAG: hypothetical protein KAJ37_02390 [Candidatus Krumholzibacteria bacterium]|nr:hypothetical protein [Candidatus Krumholzibacteria bacterium]
MCRTPRKLRALPVLPLLLIVACTQTPRMDDTKETDYIRMLREEFFKTHPDGQYNENIARGEVVKGMDFLEVLASWGNPNKREKPTDNVEYWIYLEVDEDSMDWVQYKFEFRKSVLSGWDLARHVASGREVDSPSGSNSQVLTKGSSTDIGSDKKKK